MNESSYVRLRREKKVQFLNQSVLSMCFISYGKKLKHYLMLQIKF